MMCKGRLIHKALLILLICSIPLFLISCGEGGDNWDDGGVIPPTQDLKGTYFLSAVTLVYSDGIVITQDDINISAIMSICEGTITQSFFIDETPYELTGIYTVTYTNRTSEGYFNLTESTGNLYFLISGNNLTTYSGIVPFEEGLTYEEWDTWNKVDNSC